MEPGVSSAGCGMVSRAIDVMHEEDAESIFAATGKVHRYGGQRGCIAVAPALAPTMAPSVANSGNELAARGDCAGSPAVAPLSGERPPLSGARLTRCLFWGRSPLRGASMSDNH